MSQSWKGCSWQLGLASFLAIGGAIISAATDCAFAQSVIIPDQTLGSESSHVVPNQYGGSTEVVRDGAIRGNNLFHSFVQFNVSEGRAAFFLSPSGNIQNIVVRVTGSNPSQILGTLGTFQMDVNGNLAPSNANLFLINPNGIIFGPKAVVSIGGSFVASTASSIKFADSSQFSATALPTTPLLTVSVPLGLQFGRTPGDIIVQGGLAVPPGKTLALVGGNVTLNGGTLIAGPQDGQIALGGILGAGMIGLNLDSNNLPLSFPNEVQPADVSLSNGATVDASGKGDGNIQVQGRRVTLSDGSELRADTQSQNGRGISIQAEQLSIKDGSQVSASTSGAEAGGTLAVNASDSVQLSGTDAKGNPSGLFTTTSGEGMAGNLTINTGKLIVQDGANVSVGTEMGSQGQGGSLNVTASDFVKLSGTSAISGKPSSLSTQTLGTGDAGSLTIDTNSLIVRDGGQVTAGTNTGSQGKGGTLTVQALGGSVELSGTGLNGKPTGLFARTRGSGDAGSLMINTGQLTVRDGAQVTVQSLVTGTAGNLAVNARSIRLDNKATLSADTRSNSIDPNKEQATITLRGVRDLILRRGSNITTNATGSNVIGGNINIDAKDGFIFAVPQEDSKISANSLDFRGGNVTISASDIFGIQFRNAPTSLSDITATGKDSSLNGTVQINSPDVDPSQGLVQLPTNLVEASSQIDTSCKPGSRQRASSFTITGRGGLPQSPYETLQSRAVITDWVSLPTTEAQHQESRRTKEHRNTAEHAHKINSVNPPNQIVEAQGWVIDKNGDVELVAQVPTASTHNPLFNPASCLGSRK